MFVVMKLGEYKVILSVGNVWILAWLIKSQKKINKLGKISECGDNN